MSTAKSRKIKPSKKSIPQVLRLDQRRYLTKRVDSVFGPKIAEISRQLSVDTTEGDRNNLATEMILETLRELFLAISNRRADNFKWSLDSRIVAGEFRFNTDVGRIIQLTPEQRREIAERFPQQDREALREALLLIQNDRKTISDKILLFQDPSAIADLDACEKIDYLKIALSKRKTPKLTEYRDEPSDY